MGHLSMQLIPNLLIGTHHSIHWSGAITMNYAEVQQKLNFRKILSLSHTRIMKWFYYRSITIVHLNLGYFIWFHINQCTVMIIFVSFSFCSGTCCRSTRQTFIDCAVLFVEPAIARVSLLSVSSFLPFASTAATNKSKKEEKPHRWYVLFWIFWIWVAAERWCGKCG